MEQYIEYLQNELKHVPTPIKTYISHLLKNQPELLIKLDMIIR